MIGTGAFTSVIVLNGRVDASRSKAVNGTHLSKRDDRLGYSIECVGPFRRYVMTKDELSSAAVVSILLL